MQLEINQNTRKDVDMRSQDSSEESSDIDKLFIIDHQFALNQIDFIENCSHLKNVVVLDSVLKHVNKANI